MIQINSNVCTEVLVDFDMSGNETPPTLRMYFTVGDFFCGFNGNDKRIDIPPLLNIQFPQENVRARIEVILCNYCIKIWEEEIEILQSKDSINDSINEKSINTIKIKVQLKEQTSTEPRMRIKDEN